MTWNDLTVEQFQQIYRYCNRKDIEEFEKLEGIISIMYNLTFEQIQELSMTDFNFKAKEVGFLLNQDEFIGDPNGIPLKYIKANGKTYFVNYEIKKMKYRQYVETMHYQNDPILNLHLIMASIVQPVKWGFRRENKAEDHAKIAQDILKAKMSDVYKSCVFFCKLYLTLIHNSKDYLITEMTTKGLTESEAINSLNASLEIMAGFIRHENWQPLKV